MEGLARTGAPGMSSPEPTAGQTGDGTGTGAGRGPDVGVAGDGPDAAGVGGAAVGKAVGYGAGLAGCGFAEPDAFFELAESEAKCSCALQQKRNRPSGRGFST
jgi:hypothetical protein